jgi:hypothetical protein
MFRLIPVTVMMMVHLPGCYSSFDGGPTSTPKKIKQAKQEEKSPPPNRPAEPKKKKKKKPEQTYKQAWRIICHAERLSGIDSETDPQQKGFQVASWIIKHLKNKKARYWFISLDQVEKKDRAATFRREAKRAGFDSCPSERLLFSEPRPAAPADGGGGGGS